jgi:hypothetical protein
MRDCTQHWADVARAFEAMEEAREKNPLNAP